MPKFRLTDEGLSYTNAVGQTWTTIRKEKELDLATCGDGEREPSMVTPRFLFGRLRGCGAIVSDGGQEVKVGGGSPCRHGD